MQFIFNTKFLIIFLLLNNYNSFSQTTVVFQPDSLCGVDATISSKWPTVNSGSHHDFISTAWTHSGTPSTLRGLIDFEFSAIPAGSTIISAELSLYWYSSVLNIGHSSLSFPNVAYLKRVTSPWTEYGVTWATQPTSTAVNQVTYLQSTTNSQDYLNVDVSNLVQDMINSPATSHGFLFKQVAEQYYRSLLFASSDQVNQLLNPKLVVTYLEPSLSGPILNIGNDTTICTSASINKLLDATLPGTPSYLWQDGSTNPTYTATSPGTYSVVVDYCTHYYTDTLTIDSTIVVSNNILDTTFCQGSVINITNNVPNATYFWQDSSTNSALNIAQSGIYWVDIFANGCQYPRDSFEVTTIQPLSFSLGNDTVVCPGNFITLDDDLGTYPHLWNFGSTDTMINLNTPGTYWLDITNICGTISDTFVLSNFIIDSLNSLGQDTTLCPNTNLILDATINSSPTYLWQDGSTSPTLNINQAGLYWVELYSNGCYVGRDSIEIDYLDSLILDLGNDTITCIGDNIFLNTNYPNESVVWQDNSTMPNLTVSNPGIYWASVSNSCETVTDSIEIDYHIQTLVEAFGNDGCVNTNINFGYQVITSTNSLNSYNWSFGDGGTSTLDSPSYTYNTPGTFLVNFSGLDNFGCPVEDTVLINIFNAPNAEFNTSPASGNINDEIVFNGDFTNGLTWVWNFGDGQTSIESNPIHIYENANLFTTSLIVSDGICSDTSYRSISINQEPLFYVPNAFTVGSNSNNIFYPVFTEGFDHYSYHLQIFDRYGELVFESFDSSIGWDGTYSENEISSSNVFVWKIEFNEVLIDKRHSVYGHVLLLK